MFKFTAKRIFTGLIVIFGVVTLTFLVARVMPSDPAAKWVGPRASQEQLIAARAELGLDKPLFIQYLNYIRGLAAGDLGKSLRTHQPIKDELKSAIPPTLELVLLAFVLAVFVGLPLGIYSAKYKDSFLDHTSRLFSIGVVSLPTFWVALFLQYIFYNRLEWLPLGGQMDTNLLVFSDPPSITGMLLVDCLLVGEMDLFLDALRHIVLPCIAVSLYPIGLVARMTRSALLEVLGEDYIIAARSYGTVEYKVLWKFALKNTLGPTAIVLTLSLGYTLVNTFLIEAIFSWPGLGNYVAVSVTVLDYPAIIGVTLFSSACYVVLNLIADIIIALDPRVRL
jgi:peptide/nickel transport system permease protein